MLIAFTGALEGPSLVALITVRQGLAPPHLRGQILTTVSSLNLAAIALGAALAGPLHAALGTTATLLSFGALMLAAGLVTLATGGGADRSRRHAMDRVDRGDRPADEVLRLAPLAWLHPLLHW